MAEQKDTTPMEEMPPGPPPMPENWSSMTGDEKFDYYTTGWASASGMSFASPEVAKRYELSAERWLDILALREPDQVPNMFLTDRFVLANAGIKPVDPFYNPAKAAAGVYKFNEDYDFDYSVGLMPIPGRAIDLMDYKLIRWPGSSLPQGLPDDMQFQYAEAEYMRSDEYDQLIANPEGYLLLKYLPRILGALGNFDKKLENFPSLYNAVEAAGVSSLLMPFARGGELREAVQTLMDNVFTAADHAAAHMGEFVAAGMKVMTELGKPGLIGACTFTPFDLIGDTMRCTTEVMMDMYRRPDKLVAACEALVPVSIKMAVQTAMVTRNPFVIIPLHKGADGFMSNEQFEKFYWPSFKAQLFGIIDEGLIPVPFVEGAYNQRLDILADSGLPKGKTMWIFDRTEMKYAKEKFSSFACIGGNVPASLFSTGSTRMMEDYCRDLMEYAAPGGGFFMSPGAVIDQAKPENVHAYINCTKKFGTY